jgi:hypothetical protein
MLIVGSPKSPPLARSRQNEMMADIVPGPKSKDEIKRLMANRENPASENETGFSLFTLSFQPSAMNNRYLALSPYLCGVICALKNFFLLRWLGFS